MFVRVFLAASRLQVRSLDVFVLHTSHRGAAARAVGMKAKTSTQLRVAEWTSFRRAFEQDAPHRTWHLAQRSPPSNSYRKRR